jgi:hypothetical protein
LDNPPAKGSGSAFQKNNSAEDRLKQIILSGSTWFRSLPWVEQAFTSNPDGKTIQRWSRYEYRLLRYAVYWAVYEQNLYRDINSFSEEMISERDLYSSIRTIYSPGYVIGEFWAEHIYSGLLDTEAGDGTCKPTAIPIVTDNEDLRQVIAELFRVSNLQVQMGIYARFGAVCGDVLLTAHPEGRRSDRR